MFNWVMKTLAIICSCDFQLLSTHGGMKPEKCIIITVDNDNDDNVGMCYIDKTCLYVVVV